MPDQFHFGTQHLPSDPNISLLILVVGILGIYLEFSAPGKIIPGAAGGAMALTGLAALRQFPLSPVGIVLLVMAFLCCVAEARRPSGGWLTALAAALMVFGSLLLVEVRPGAGGITPACAIAAGLPLATVSSFLFSVAWKAKRNKTLTVAALLVGCRATAVAPMQPDGFIQIGREQWPARAEGSVASGAEVIVYGTDGMTLLVRSATSGYAMEKKPS